VTSSSSEPARAEALAYYRRAAQHYDLKIRLGFEANRIFIENGRHHGEVITRSIAGRRRE